jgi:hypothetical protein
VLERGSILTAEGNVTIWIPRPHPPDEDVQVQVYNKTDFAKYKKRYEEKDKETEQEEGQQKSQEKSQEKDGPSSSIVWKSSETYILGAGVGIFLAKGPIRGILINVRYRSGKQ